MAWVREDIKGAECANSTSGGWLREPSRVVGGSARRKTVAPPVHRATTLSSGRSGHARIVVVADTHSRPHPDSVDLVRGLEPDAILHAGDIGDVSVLAPFEAVAPLVVVRGNIDGRTNDLPDGVDIRVMDVEGAALSRLWLQHIAVYGPKLRGDAARAAKAHDAQIVVCGHSHVPFIGQDKGLLVFNPGSIGPRRFHLPIVFGVIELWPGRAQMHHVDCETGTRWTPNP